MRKWLWGGIVLLLGCLVWVGAVRSQIAPDPLDPPDMQGALLADRLAYVVLPPEIVCGPRVESVSPSDSGSYNLIDRRIVPDTLSRFSPTPEFNLILWDATTRRSYVLWRETFAKGLPANQVRNALYTTSFWFQDQPVALSMLVTAGPAGEAALEQKDKYGNPLLPARFLLIHAGKRTAQVAFTGTSSDQVIPNGKLPIIAHQPFPGKTIRILDTDGKVVRTATAPSEAINWLNWLPDGKTLLGLEMTTRIDENTQKPVRERMYYQLNTETGALERQTSFPRPRSEDTSGSASLPFAIVSGKGQIQNMEDPKRVLKLRPLWLVGNEKEAQGRVLVTTDGDREILSAYSIYYYSRGTLFAAPIVRIPMTEYLAIEKSRTMQRAKQVGLGLMMYAQDYDEAFPPPGDNISDIVDPYLRDQSLMQGFTPLYKETNLTAIQQPATTPIGFINGPGGQAVIYADGHVKWQDKKP